MWFFRIRVFGNKSSRTISLINVSIGITFYVHSQLVLVFKKSILLAQIIPRLVEDGSCDTDVVTNIHFVIWSVTRPIFRRSGYRTFEFTLYLTWYQCYYQINAFKLCLLTQCKCELKSTMVSLISKQVKSVVKYIKQILVQLQQLFWLILVN